MKNLICKFFINISHVKSKKDVMTIKIMDKDRFGSDDLEGIVQISCDELLHQNKIDDWIGLIDENSNQEKGFLRVVVQLIWSKYEFYSNLYSKAVEQMNRINADIIQIDKYLDLIDKPFGIILYGEIINLTDSKILEKGEEAINYVTGSRNFLNASKLKGNESLASKFDNMFSGIFSKYN